MRIHNLHVAGVLRFDRAVDIDFDALGEGVIAFAGRNGCLRGDTPIQDPVDGTTVAVRERCDRGMPFHVWALGPHGPVVTAALPPLKFPAHQMICFELETGETITVTPNHRFLGNGGWLPASAVVRIFRASGAVRLPSTSDNGLQVHAADGLRWKEIKQDSQVDCQHDLRSDGGQPLPVGGNDQGFVPSLTDAHGHIRKRSQKGGQEFSKECIHPRQPHGPRAKTCCESSAHHGGGPFLPGYELLLPHAWQLNVGSGPLPGDFRQPYNNLTPSVFDPESKGLDQVSCDPPLRPVNEQDVLQTYLRTAADSIAIVGVQELAAEPYYDFHVPVYLNYWAAGIWHHNSGKTTILECSGPGILFREFPSRDKSPGPLISNWVRPGGCEIREQFSLGGHRYDARVIVDKAGAQSAYLKQDGDPNPLVSGKVRDYDAAIARLFGHKGAFYAGPFGMQEGKGRFGSLDPADRKAIFRYYLQLDRIQQLHGVAKARLDQLDGSKLEELNREIGRLDGEAIPRARVDLDMARGHLRTAEAELNTRKARMDQVQQQVAMGDLVAMYHQAMDEVVDAQDDLQGLLDTPIVAPAGKCPEVAAAQAKLDAATQGEKAILQASGEAQLQGSQLRNRSSIVAQAIRQCEIIDRVPCKAQGECAACEFLTDAVEVRGRLPALQKDEADARTAYGRAMSALDEIKSKGLDTAGIRQALAEVTRSREAWLGAKAKADLYGSKLEAAQTRVTQAKARARELYGKLPKPIPTDLPTKRDLQVQQGMVDEATRTMRVAVQTEANAVALLTQLDESRARNMAGAAKEKAKLEDLDPWQLLVRALGPNGVQAYEIDAAGPRVTTLANDLLHVCYGGRFQVEIQTLQALKGGDGYKEVFDIRVADSVRGREGSINDLSPGERGIVEEPLRLALALFGAERSSVPIRTLWRDEPSAALDADNARAYAAMLHRAREIGGFHHVLCIAHQQEVIDAADVVIRVQDDGSVEVG